MLVDGTFLSTASVSAFASSESVLLCMCVGVLLDYYILCEWTLSTPTTEQEHIHNMHPLPLRIESHSRKHTHLSGDGT